MTCCSRLCRQLGLLVWKNFILQVCKVATVKLPILTLFFYSCSDKTTHWNSVRVGATNTCCCLHCCVEVSFVKIYNNSANNIAVNWCMGTVTKYVMVITRARGIEPSGFSAIYTMQPDCTCYITSLGHTKLISCFSSVLNQKS